MWILEQIEDPVFSFLVLQDLQVYNNKCKNWVNYSFCYFFHYQTKSSKPW